MKRVSLARICALVLCAVLCAVLLTLCGVRPALAESAAVQAQDGSTLVRLSRISVDPARLAAYRAFLKEEIEASMRLEEGVLVLYAVSEKEQPHRFTILEIYADGAAYKRHLQTPHFLKYKEGTRFMVRELELIDASPLIPGLKIK